MFNFDFFELMVIGVVALVVIGPERLPTVARGAGRLMGRFQRFMNSMAEDLNKELEIEKLKKMHQNAQLELQKANQIAQEQTQKAHQALSETERQFNAAGQEVGQAVTDAAQQTATEVKQASTVEENQRLG